MLRDPHDVALPALRHILAPPPGASTSCVYVGSVVHRRVEPVRHEFRYRIALLCIDLAEAGRLQGLAPLWGFERHAPVSWRRKDHFGDPRVPLEESVRNLVAERTGHSPRGVIRLVTSPRVFGYGFNPISLYLCDDEGGDLECIVAEVTSTPWLERHCYVLPVPVARRGQAVQRFVTAKELHVSPFLDMQQDYRWRIELAADRLSVAITATAGSGKPFTAALTLVRQPLSRSSLLRCALQPAFGAAGTMAAIHFEAFRLWWKGAPYHPHPAGDGREQCPASRRPNHDDRACAA